VKFTVNKVTKETGSNGVVCFDGLPWSGEKGTSYTVKETVPDGFVVAGGSSEFAVTVDKSASCKDATGPATLEVSNIPKTDLSVSINSQVDGGTKSEVICKNSKDETIASGKTSEKSEDWGDGSVGAKGLLPDTYTCTVVVDP